MTYMRSIITFSLDACLHIRVLDAKIGKIELQLNSEQEKILLLRRLAGGDHLEATRLTVFFGAGRARQGPHQER